MQRYLEKFGAIATRNRRVFALVLPLIILLFISLPISAQAWWNPFSFIDDVLTNAIVTIVTFVPASIFFIVAGLVNWIIGMITAIGIIPGAESAIHTPVFVQVGWEFSRDLINALFVIILVFIGLATILRLQTYQLQKTLPGLIIIALLVNFSAVLVGFIVDISNIIANIFLDATGSIQFSVFQTIFSNGENTLEDLNFAQGIVYAFVLAIFYLVSALIFFILFLLFFVRTIILWLLVVLAPLAFGAYILPATKKYWTQWLQQLIQWSIIGIPIGFFLYLSNFILHLGEGVFATSPDVIEDLDFLGGLISSMLSPIVGIMVLFVGIMLSMQLAPAAAQGIIDRGKKTGIGLSLWAGSNMWRTFGGKLEKMGAGIRQKGQTMEASAQEKMQTAGLGLGAKAWAGISKFAVAKPTRTLGSLLEMGTGEVNKRTNEKIQRVMGEGQKATQGKSYQEASTLMQRELAKPGLHDWDRVVGYMNGIIKNEDSEDLVKDIESGRFNMDQMAHIYKTSRAGGSPFRRPIEKALLGYALDEVDEATGQIVPNRLGVSEEHQKALLEEKLTGEDIAKIIAPQNLDLVNPATAPRARHLIEQMMLKGSHELVPQLLKRSGLEQRRAIQKLFEDLGQQWFIDNNRLDILKYSISPAAASLGINPIGGITQDQLTALVATKKSTEQLKQEMGNIEVQLADTATTTAQRAILTKRQKQIAPQLTFRAGFGPEDAKDDNAQIQAKRSEYNTAVQNLQALETATPAASRNEDYYRQEATLVKKRDEIASEFKRRGLKMKEAVATPLEDQPLSVQIARLKEQESRLAAQAKLPYLPGEKARDQRKKIQQKLKNLEERLYATPPLLFDKEVELGRIEGEIIDNEKKVQDIEQNIATQRQLGATQQEIQQLEALKIPQQQEIQRLNQEKAGAITSWEGTRAQIQLVTPETAIAKDFAQALAEERQYRSQLAQQRTAKETKDKLQATRELLGHAGQTRQRAEQRITGVLRAQQLQRESRAASGMRIPNFQTIVTRNEAEIQRIKQVEGDFDTIVKTGNVITLGRGLAHKPTSALTPQERQLITDYEKEIAKLKETEEIKKQISKLLKEEKKAHS